MNDIVESFKNVQGNGYKLNMLKLYYLGTECLANFTVILKYNMKKYNMNVLIWQQSISVWTCVVLKSAFGFISVVS